MESGLTWINSQKLASLTMP